ncbi:MAG TPA: hypothetical protein VH054_08320 [Polyangiaceae bacterium]|nr:hypothetical protein [Polyangiaceae bacterium]
MSEACKLAYCGPCGLHGPHVGPIEPGVDNTEDECWGCSREHVREFGHCIGIVDGPIDWNDVGPGHPAYDPAKLGPEIDVRWQPSNLRYGYDPECFEKVD